jgi:hypothetical protein
MAVKDYFNTMEANDFMVIRYGGKMAEKVLKEWGARGQLTKEEAKFLKYMATYGEKFFNEVGNRLSLKERVKINKRLAKFDFRLVDDYNSQKIFREAEEAMKTAVIPRDDFEEICCYVMEHECAGCTKDWNSCWLHDAFENNMAPEPTGYEKPNCRYAYDPHVKFKKTVMRATEVKKGSVI